MRLISQRGVHFPPGQPKVDVFFSDSRVRSLYVRTMHCDPYTPPQLGDQQSRTKKPQPAPLGLSDLAGGGSAGAVEPQVLTQPLPLLSSVSRPLPQAVVQGGRGSESTFLMECSSASR